jgi:hypothetical protein
MGMSNAFVIRATQNVLHALYLPADPKRLMAVMPA